MAGKFIAIAGNIGSGKTSLVDFLYRQYGVIPFFEPNEENPYLPDFYGDMRRWAFHSQLYFLVRKFKQHLKLYTCQGIAVQDRTIYEDAEIFAQNLYQSRLMDERDYETYRDLYGSIRDILPPPDLMIYLRCSVRTIRKRIKLRGRQMEQNIPTSYLKSLHKLYEDWFERYSLSETLFLNTDKLDYITDLVDRLEVTSAITSYF